MSSIPSFINNEIDVLRKELERYINIAHRHAVKGWSGKAEEVKDRAKQILARLDDTSHGRDNALAVATNDIFRLVAEVEKENVVLSHKLSLQIERSASTSGNDGSSRSPLPPARVIEQVSQLCSEFSFLEALYTASNANESSTGKASIAGYPWMKCFIKPRVYLSNKSTQTEPIGSVFNDCGIDDGTDATLCSSDGGRRAFQLGGPINYRRQRPDAILLASSSSRNAALSPYNPQLYEALRGSALLQSYLAAMTTPLSSTLLPIAELRELTIKGLPKKSLASLSLSMSSARLISTVVKIEFPKDQDSNLGNCVGTVITLVLFDSILALCDKDRVIRMPLRGIAHIYRGPVRPGRAAPPPPSVTAEIPQSIVLSIINDAEPSASWAPLSRSAILRQWTRAVTIVMCDISEPPVTFIFANDDVTRFFIVVELLIDGTRDDLFSPLRLSSPSLLSATPFPLLPARGHLGYGSQLVGIRPWSIVKNVFGRGLPGGSDDSPTAGGCRTHKPLRFPVPAPPDTLLSPPHHLPLSMVEAAFAASEHITTRLYCTIKEKILGDPSRAWISAWDIAILTPTSMATDALSEDQCIFNIPLATRLLRFWTAMGALIPIEVISVDKAASVARTAL